MIGSVYHEAILRYWLQALNWYTSNNSIKKCITLSRVVSIFFLNKFSVFLESFSKSKFWMIFPHLTQSKEGLFPHRKQAFYCLCSSEDITAINHFERIHICNNILQFLSQDSLYIVFCHLTFIYY